MSRARRLVPDDDGVGIERLEDARRVLEGLALAQGGGLGGEVDDVRRQALGGQFEADPGAGGGFNEEVDDRLAAEGGHLLDGALAHRLEGPGGVEDDDDLLRAQGLDVEQVLAVPVHVDERR